MLRPDELQSRRVVWIDIADDKIPDNPPTREPSTFVSEKTGRGKLEAEFWKQAAPVMCCYKLVTIKFQVFGFQTRVEDTIQKVTMHHPPFDL